MTGMPYALEIGALFDAIADTYNAMDIPGRQAALHQLYTEADFIKIGYFPGDASGTSKTPFGKDMSDKFNGDAMQREKARVDHMNKDWLGKGVAGKTTGWWAAWKGDVEGIIRETLIRAVEVSLGYSHNGRGYHDEGTPGTRTKGTASVLPSDPPDWPAPHLARPLEFLWTCGSPRFDGWVHWRGAARDPVTVVFTTPGPLHPNGEMNMSLRLTADPANPPNPKIHPEDVYAVDPQAHTLSGVWVIGHDVAKPTKVYELRRFKDWLPIGESFAEWTVSDVVVGQDPIVVVQPSIYDGGIDPNQP